MQLCFSIVAFSHQWLNRHMVTVLSIIAAVGRVTGVTQLGEWLHLRQAAACCPYMLLRGIPARASVHCRENSSALRRWEWWEINYFLWLASWQWGYDKWSIFLGHPTGEMQQPLGLRDHMVHSSTEGWKPEKGRKKWYGSKILVYLTVPWGRVGISINTEM